MESAQIISKNIVLQYRCSKDLPKHEVVLTNFDITQESYFEDWQYTCIRFTCPLCGERHSFEV